MATNNLRSKRIVKKTAPKKKLPKIIHKKQDKPEAVVAALIPVKLPVQRDDSAEPFNDALYNRLENGLSEVPKDELDQALGAVQSEIDAMMPGAPTGVVNDAVVEARNRLLEQYQDEYLDSDAAVKKEAIKPPVAPVIPQTNPIDVKVKAKAKIALLKRHEEEAEPKRLSLDQQIIRIVNNELRRAEEEAKEKYHINAEDINTKEATNLLLFARSQVLKPMRTKGILADKFLKSNWPAEYEKIVNEKIPNRWMLDDPLIREGTMRKNKTLMPIMNCLHNMARGASKSDRLEMVELSMDLRHRTEKPKINKDGTPAMHKDGTPKMVVNRWPVSCFKANANFYNMLAAATGFSVRNAKMVIRALINIGAIIAIRKLPGGVPIISFGYYTAYSGNVRHIHNVTKPAFQDSLRSFILA